MIHRNFATCIDECAVDSEASLVFQAASELPRIVTGGLALHTGWLTIPSSFQQRMRVRSHSGPNKGVQMVQVITDRLLEDHLKCSSFLPSPSGPIWPCH